MHMSYINMYEGHNKEAFEELAKKYFSVAQWLRGWVNMGVMYSPMLSELAHRAQSHKHTVSTGSSEKSGCDVSFERQGGCELESHIRLIILFNSPIPHNKC